MENVPLVVINVGTESVALPGNELIEFGVIVGVTPGGLPEVTLRLTVPVNPPDAARLSVNEAVAPAPTVCELGEALIEKSGPDGVAESSVNVVLPSVPSICKRRTVGPSAAYAEAGGVKLVVQRAVPFDMRNSSSHPLKSNPPPAYLPITSEPE